MNCDGVIDASQEGGRLYTLAVETNEVSTERQGFITRLCYQKQLRVKTLAHNITCFRLQFQKSQIFPIVKINSFQWLRKCKQRASKLV